MSARALRYAARAMVGRSPEFRVSNARDLYDYLEDFAPGSQAELAPAIPAGWLALVAHGTRTGWLSAALDGAFVTAVHAHFGATEMKRLYRSFTATRLLHSPALRTLLDGMIRLFGLSVGTLLRALPGGFQQSYRDVCEVSLERGEGYAVVTLSDIAPEVLRYPAYLVMWEGVFLGIFDLAHAPPRLTLTHDEPRRTLRARFEW